MTVRTGLGFDAHVFAPERPLMLGGIDIPFDRGLAGHSDGDVLAHAICDALLGAAGLGDLGDMFPPTPEWTAAAGADLLRAVAERVGATIAWVDATVLCEQPRIGEHRNAMRKAVAAALGVSADVVSIKATSTDGMGFTGRGEGIAAMAIATLVA